MAGLRTLNDKDPQEILRIYKLYASYKSPTKHQAEVVRQCLRTLESKGFGVSSKKKLFKLDEKIVNNGKIPQAQPAENGSIHVPVVPVQVAVKATKKEPDYPILSKIADVMQGITRIEKSIKTLESRQKEIHYEMEKVQEAMIAFSKETHNEHVPEFKVILENDRRRLIIQNGE